MTNDAIISLTVATALVQTGLDPGLAVQYLTSFIIRLPFVIDKSNLVNKSQLLVEGIQYGDIISGQLSNVLQGADCFNLIASKETRQW